MNIVFAGTPDFAATVLAGLLHAGHPVTGVLTRPDRPSGRGRKLLPGPVKRLAVDHGLPVLQPASLRDGAAVARLAALAPELMVVAAYGLILPERVLTLPPRGCINVHASLLPRWRGAAPIQRAILAGDRESGVCIMRMEAGLDTGPVLLRRTTPIGPGDTAGDLHERLAALGSEALLEAVAALEAGDVPGQPQPEDGVTYAHRIGKAESRVRWEQDAPAVVRQIHAFNPYPGAWSELPETPGIGDRRLKLLRAAARPLDPPAAPGTVVSTGDGRMLVACSTGAVAITELKPAGRRAMSAAEFLNARTLTTGDRLR